MGNSVATDGKSYPEIRRNARLALAIARIVLPICGASFSSWTAESPSREPGGDLANSITLI
jgi:hypothetical protein